MGDINNFAVALQLNQILQQNEPGSVNQLLQKNPENFFRFADFITLQSSEKNRAKKLDLESKKFAFKMSKLDIDAALAKLTATPPKNQGS